MWSRRQVSLARLRKIIERENDNFSANKLHIIPEVLGRIIEVYIRFYVLLMNGDNVVAATSLAMYVCFFLKYKETGTFFFITLQNWVFMSGPLALKGVFLRKTREFCFWKKRRLLQSCLKIVCNLHGVYKSDRLN